MGANCRCLQYPDDVAAVEAIRAHYDPTVREPRWWWAHPTVVAEQDGVIVGYATFSLALPPTPSLAESVNGTIGWGHGMAVHPAYHRHGIGRQLADYRTHVLAGFGVRFFIGHAAPGNQAMETIFAAQGLRAACTIAQHGPTKTPMTFYMGDLH